MPYSTEVFEQQTAAVPAASPLGQALRRAQGGSEVAGGFNSYVSGGFNSFVSGGFNSYVAGGFNSAVVPTGGFNSYVG